MQSIMNKPKYPKTKTICVDVDGTLVIDGRLNKSLVDWCKDRAKDGFTLYLWSARGAKHAEDMADLHHVGWLFHAFVSKPGFVVDDMGHGWAKYMTALLPDVGRACQDFDTPDGAEDRQVID